MKKVEVQLLSRRGRNRIIEVLELCASPEFCSQIGSFEVINSVDDFLPLKSDEFSGEFSPEELLEIECFLEIYEKVCDATTTDVNELEWFLQSPFWVSFFQCASKAHDVFMKRGTSSE